MSTIKHDYIKPSYVKELVEDYTSISLTKKTNKPIFADVKFLYYKLCSEFCLDNFSHDFIGETIGQDHSLSIRGIRRFEELKDSKSYEPTLRTYNSIKQRLILEKQMSRPLTLSESEEKTKDDIVVENRVRFIKMQEKYRIILSKKDLEIKQLLKLSNLSNKKTNLSSQDKLDLEKIIDNFIKVRTQINRNHE